MADKKDVDALGDLLSDELGEWDAMFDSLHEDGSPDEVAFAPADESADEPGGAVPRFVGPVTPSGSFDIQSTIGAPFDGMPESGASVDQLVPGEEVSSPFADEEEDFGKLFGAQPEALGGLLGSGPVNREAGPDSGLRPPSAIDVRAGVESLARAKPTGPEDAAFDDFEESTDIVAKVEIATELAKSAAAFFDDDGGQSNDVSLELDDDFYDGIQIGEASADADAALVLSEASSQEAVPKSRTFANVVRRESAVPMPIEREHSEAAAFAALDSFVDDDEDENTNILGMPLPPATAPQAEESFLALGVGNEVEGLETLAALAPIEDDYDPLDDLESQYGEHTLASLPNIETETEPDDFLPNIETAPEPDRLPILETEPEPEALPGLDELALPEVLPAALDVSAPAPLPAVEAAPLPEIEAAPSSQALPAIEATAEGDTGSLDAALDSAIEGLVLAETRPAPGQVSSPESDAALPEFSGDGFTGVVEAAVEDAVAMSTGTLLTGPRLQDLDVEPDLPPEKFARAVPGPELGAISVAEDVGLADNDRTDEYAQLLVLYGRELLLLDEVAPTMRLRMEAGRISESLGDLEQARVHFDEALKFDPHLVPANRALRRIERVLGNWDEVIRLLGKELTNLSPAEVDALTLSRIGLLMAVGEMDLARVAVGELLDASPTDARALLANLDLSFVDGRADEIESTLDALAEVLTEPSLTGAVLNFCAALAEEGGRNDKAVELYGRASAMLPSLGSALALRSAALKADSAAVALEALEAARLSAQAPLRAALDWQRSELYLANSEKRAAQELLSEAMVEAPDDVLLGQQRLRAFDQDRAMAATASQALAHLAEGRVWQQQLWGRAARLSDGTDAMPLYEKAAGRDHASGFAATELRTAQISHGQWQEVYESSGHESTPGTPVGSYRRAQAALRSGQARDALRHLSECRDSQEAGSQPMELTFLELAYSVNEQQVLSGYRVPEAIAGTTELQLAERIRSRALTRLAIANVTDTSLLKRAAESWSALAELEGEGKSATDTALLVASMSQDSEVLLPRLEASENHAGFEDRVIQVAVESAGLALAESVEAGAERIFSLQATRPCERGAILQWSFALGAGDLAAAAACFEAEARRVDSSDSESADRFLYRAAFLRVQDEIAPSLAADSLQRIAERRPGFGAAASLLKSLASRSGAASTRTGAAKGEGAPAITQDNLSAEIRRAETLARAGDHAAATEIFSALQLAHPHDTLVAYAFQRACWEGSASPLLAEHALTALRVAEERKDGVAKARACEELARVDGELRGDYGTALMFWESASLADPGRADLLRTLQRELGNQGAFGLDGETAWKALGRLIETADAGPERSAYLVERARIGLQLERPESEALADYTQAFEDNDQCREALFFLEATASQAGASNNLADLEKKVSQYFAGDARARAAFLVRAGETLRSLEQPELAMASFRSATETMPGFAPALFAWRDMALDDEMWEALAEACLLEAASVQNDKGRAHLYHLAGVTLMDKAEDEDRAMDALRRVLVVDVMHRDAFVRLRKLYSENDKTDELAQLYSMRLEVETDEAGRCELLHARAELMRHAIGNLTEALAHVRAVLDLRPNDKRAMVAVSELAWDLEKWAEAAEALMVLARVETQTPELISVFSKLGTIYMEHLPEPKWALKSFRRVISLDPTNLFALAQFAELSAESGDHKLALGAYEQLIKQDPPVDEKIVYLRRMAQSFLDGFGDTTKAERALRVALDLDLANESAFDALIDFYLSQDNKRSARVHMDLVANAMRQRLRNNPTDVVAYRVIAHAMEARFKAGIENSRVIARAAASMAIMLGDTSQAMKALVASTKYLARGNGLGGEAHDDFVYPKAALGGARALLKMLGERLAKHLGTDVRSHGVGRSDRLRGRDNAIADMVAQLATEMGLEHPEVYLSVQMPLVLAGEPTRPASLVFGKELVAAERAEELRFLAGRLLKMATAFLSTPLRLGEEKFGVLLVGLLRQFQADFAPVAVDEAEAAAEQQRLRRLIPSGMVQELAPFAMGLASSDFDHKAIWQALVDAGNRAGLLCAGDVQAAVKALMRHKGIREPAAAMQDTEIVNLVRFACSEDHANVYSALA